MRRLLTLATLVAGAALAVAGVASADQGSTVTVGVGAHTSLTRTYNWVVTKTDDQNGSLTVAQGATASIGYTITASNGSPAFTDSDWMVFDGITMTSPNPFTLNGTKDISTTATQGTTTTSGTSSMCSFNSLFNPPVSFPVTFPGFGPSLLCNYTIPLPSGTPGTVAADVTFSDGSTASGSTSFNFDSGPGGTLEELNSVDQTVDVVDSQGGSLGTLTAPVDALHPATFTYSVPVDTSTCGSHLVTNTVDLVDQATGSTVASATDMVNVTVTCPPPPVSGCTLTQGYWKTHSVLGPANPANPTWDLVGGPNAAFFLSGQSWIDVFNTSPKGNPYYILAHQYEAAILNGLSGASSTAAVDTALADAQSFLDTYTPAQAAALKDSSIGAAAIADAGTLDDYNSGLIGPGHCG